MNRCIKSFMDNIPKLNEAYFGRGDGLRIRITHPVDEDTEKYVMRFLRNGEINDYVVAWKNGRIRRDGTAFSIDTKNGNYINGYGRIINKAQLDTFLETVCSVWEKANEKEKQDFEYIYSKLVGQEIPDNFGSVQIINLIFFLSKMKLPIYDKYAHIAAKSLLMNKQPDEIVVCC